MTNKRGNELSKVNKFTWGDSIVIAKNVPSNFHPGAIASVCSVIKISPEDVLVDASLKGSHWYYTVEFADGSSIEVPEGFLEKYEEKTS